jgi:hypothetical protein
MFFSSSVEEIIIKHVDLDWTVNFEKQTIKAIATLKFEIVAKSVEKIVSLHADFSLDLSNNIFFSAFRCSRGQNRINFD